MSNVVWSPWKVASIGLAAVVTTVLVTALVVGNWKETTEVTQPAPTGSKARPRQAVATPSAPAAAQAPARPAAAPPSAADVEACNTYAKSVTADKTTEVVKDAVIGGAIGAGVGAAGGAIAAGGKGAGKGAAIGGIVGATAGTLYGLNEANKQDARAVEAYRTCMRERGYSG
jgi:hypothetical protein